MDDYHAVFIWRYRMAFFEFGKGYDNEGYRQNTNTPGPHFTDMD